MLPSEHDEPPAPAGRFATTQWSLVLAARDQAAPWAREALAALCRAYWYPLYAFVRRQGYGADQAQDLTQEFFARLLEKDFLQVVDREKGKFRSFLLAACKHFLANERDRANARKRGGGRTCLPLDFGAAEGRYGLEPAHALTPEKLFARRWALTLLDQVLAQLREEFLRAGKGPLFERLKVFLAGEKGTPSYDQVARELGSTEGAVRVSVHRLRKRYRELLCAEIARTVHDPGQIGDEIRDLFTALGS
jgi:RNA polymerase sigma-70 factor (ECF subfamily)